MKRNRGFVVPEDIDLLLCVVKLKQHWRSFLLAFVVGICGGYYHFRKTLPLPATKAVLEIGFPEISNGLYPNGDRFDKNDLVSIKLIHKTIDAIPELRQKNSLWTPESLYGALSLSEIYPQEVQNARDALSRSGLTQQEKISNYEVVSAYFPSKFVISFQPSPLMSTSLQQKFLEELGRQYSTFVLTARIPLSLPHGEEGSALTETDKVATYSYLAAAVDEIDTQIATSKLETAVSAITHSNIPNIPGTPNVVQQQNRTNTHNEKFARLGGVTNSTALQRIKMEMASIEHLIFNEKTVPDPNEFRYKLASEIATLSTEIDTKKKQAEYKLNLARIPNEAAPKLNANSSAHSSDNTIIGMLLSYNDQYYSLINEANVLFDDISRMEGKLVRLKERLKLFETGTAAPNDIYEARNKALGEHLKLAQSYLVTLVNELTHNTAAAYANTRPPVASFAVISETASISMRKVALTGGAAALLVVCFYLLKIIFSEMEAQRQAAFPALKEIDSEQKVNFKK